MQTLEGEVSALRQSLLQSQVHERKHNLLIYGLEGNENSPRETIEIIRKFAVEKLKMDEDFAKRISFKNAHRLRKRENATTPIIAVFLFWTERDAFLRAGKNLAGSRISIRTDLPPELKLKRSILAREAFEMRRDNNIQARVRERGTDVWIETRGNNTEQWGKRL